jgi:hypothetical protein
MYGFFAVCLPVLSTSCQNPYFNSSTLLPRVLVGNYRFFFKSVNGCYACNKYSVSAFRQAVIFQYMFLFFSYLHSYFLGSVHTF